MLYGLPGQIGGDATRRHNRFENRNKDESVGRKQGRRAQPGRQRQAHQPVETHGYAFTTRG